MDDLFSHNLGTRFDEFAPLAARMRPRTLDEFVGQEKVVGPASPLRSLIKGDALHSLVLWGPPGSGKTSIARIVAGATNSIFKELSATSAAVADVRKAIAEAKDALGSTGAKTIVFIDEIHRFNKSQQDALLPAVENRWIVLIGATTENPSFEINSALLSRMQVIRLEQLTSDDIAGIVDRALVDAQRGLGGSGIRMAPEALEHIVATSGGDARSALNALEITVAAATMAGVDLVDLAMAKEALQRREVRYDKAGDVHYDVVSAFIKSMRGSDPDAALFWLVTMLEGGEDPRFIARRMVIFASEDIGNADPMALLVAVGAFQALEFVGLPEAALNLSQAVTYLATAHKSNASTKALSAATDAVKRVGVPVVPSHLRSGPQPGSAAGPAYRYPHDAQGAWVDQSYRPVDVDRDIYYEPTDRGEEKSIGERLRAWRSRRHIGE